MLLGVILRLALEGIPGRSPRRFLLDSIDSFRRFPQTESLNSHSGRPIEKDGRILPPMGCRVVRASRTLSKWIFHFWGYSYFGVRNHASPVGQFRFKTCKGDYKPSGDCKPSGDPTWRLQISIFPEGGCPIVRSWLGPFGEKPGRNQNERQVEVFTSRRHDDVFCSIFSWKGDVLVVKKYFFAGR